MPSENSVHQKWRGEGPEPKLHVQRTWHELASLKSPFSSQWVLSCCELVMAWLITAIRNASMMIPAVRLLIGAILPSALGSFRPSKKNSPSSWMPRSTLALDDRQLISG